MSLTPEWRRRVDAWRKELLNHFYIPLGTLELAGFTTTAQLTLDEALRGTFRPVQAGTRWGAKWEYGWFRGQFVLPEAAAGQRIVLRPDVGAESLVFINGQVAGARDKEHFELTLSNSGVPGTRYEIVLEAYAGHGPQVVHAGPIPPGRETVPEPGPTQAVLGLSSFGIWQELAYQLWFDLETLYSLRNSLDPDSLRVAEIDAGLRDVSLIVDFELPAERMLETFQRGRERLRPLLECVNGSTTPTLFAFGHGHLDVAWLWPLQETERKAARTMANQLALMQEYPGYAFLHSQPHLYWMLQQRYPELYTRARQALRDGQLIAEGGMWVEADTNVTGGESLIRQFVHGKRFLREELGVESELLWLPDVFGYSGALPQILRGCGINYFSTAKILWAYNATDIFPHTTFWWEGIDGSSVLTHICKSYGSQTDPATLITRWNERLQKDGIATMILPFGHGDGGGGPTRQHLEFLRRAENLEGAPRVRLASPITFFKDLEQRGIPEVRYVGELYFQAHRGTYTSQARTKQGNRRSEVALREAELWGAVARALASYAYPQAELDEAWRSVLLNQFHDILPGSSIARVYEEAEAAYIGVLETAGRVARAATASLVNDGEGLTLFNSLAWERTTLVELPAGVEGAVDARGAQLPVQRSGDTTLVEVRLPACGWTTLRPGAESPAPPAAFGARAAGRTLENELLRLELNARGEISSLFDKQSGRELAAGPCNSFKLYKDVPGLWDAWDIDSVYTLTPVELPEPAQIEVLSAGPLLASLRMTRQLHNSTLTQELRLRAGSRRVDFVTTVDWRERHKLLKVNFPVTIHSDSAIHEIQFGHIRRPTHQSRPFDADRFEVAQQRWSALAEEHRGVAVLNDCKYGISVSGNSLNLTLLKSAMAPDMHADQGLQHFTYSLYVWHGSFGASEVVREAYELNMPPMVLPGVAGERSLFSIDAPNIVLETVKPAEDGSSDLVLRLYEAKRMATRCTLTTALPVTEALETDMLEQAGRPLQQHGSSISLEFRPFEIKTIRLQVGATTV